MAQALMDDSPLLTLYKASLMLEKLKIWKVYIHIARIILCCWFYLDYKIWIQILLSESWWEFSSILKIFYFIEKEFEMLLMLKALLGDLYLLNTGDHFEQKLQPVQISDIENSVLTRLREKQYFWNEASNTNSAHSNK